MATLAVESELESLVASLGELRTATPVDDPNYDTIRRQYREASNRLSLAIGKAIDEADLEYRECVAGLKAAVAAINEALKRIEKAAEAVNVVAQALDLVGKVVAKLV